MAQHHEAIVIGGGISGLVTLKTLRQKGIDCVLYEAKEYHGGLWHYSPTNYGVTQSTHINVSKYNYAFSDFPFPDDTVDFPHHSVMAEYVDKYVEHFELYNHIRYKTKVLDVTKAVDSDKKQMWRLCCHSLALATEFVATCDYLIIATGHHAKPKTPDFPGQDKFAGVRIHSVDYKSAASNGFANKNVVIVGIGNSAIDAAVDCAGINAGHAKVYLSTRSGAWVLPNYVFAQPIDLYASRFFLRQLPLSVQQFILETIVKVIAGHPNKWNLNPKMGILQTQPTVSPTLIHHIQRGNVKVVPNIKEIRERSVEFDDGSFAHDVDVIVNCTGYEIDLPFLSSDITSQVLGGANDLKLYKNVFHPKIGAQLAFIGFVQPSSGGVLPISEIQAQWLAMLIKGHIKLPPVMDMKEAIVKDRQATRERFYKSARHTIQKDPLTYNDEIAEFIGSKPKLVDHLPLALRLFIGSGGVAQWTLQGPFFNPEAKQLVKKVPVPYLSSAMFFGLIFLAILLLQLFLSRLL